MKTNQVMVRKMGVFEVQQRTKDGMFNATNLLKQWNDISDSGRKLSLYFESEKTKEFIDTIMQRENLHNPKTVYVKSRASRGDNAGTWMSPMLFIDFAMWINPSFKYDVIKFVYDEMIKYRNMAGDAYRRLAEAISGLVGKDRMKEFMPQVAKAVNLIVFGNHESNERNKHGNEKLQRELFRFEIKVAELIEEGFIKSEKELTQYLRKKWDEKFVPKVLKQEEYNK